MSNFGGASDYAMDTTSDRERSFKEVASEYCIPMDRTRVVSMRIEQNTEKEK